MTGTFWYQATILLAIRLVAIALLVSSLVLVSQTQHLAQPALLAGLGWFLEFRYTGWLVRRWTQNQED